MIENNADALRGIISPFHDIKRRVRVRAGGKELGISFGMAEAGYDMTLLHEVRLYGGYSVLGVTGEAVTMPSNMVAKVIGKSTWARLGVHLNVTEVDPGFGQDRTGGCYITLELSYMPRWQGITSHWRHALYPATLTIPKGAGIGCLQFLYLTTPCIYDGKYGSQGPKPIDAR